MQTCPGSGCQQPGRQPQPQAGQPPHPGLWLWQPREPSSIDPVRLLQPSLGVPGWKPGGFASVHKKKQKIKGNHLRKGHWRGLEHHLPVQKATLVGVQEGPQQSRQGEEWRGTPDR